MSLTPVSPEAPPTSRRRWLVLGVACIAQLMVVLDATVVNIALPSAQRSLGFDDATRQWIVSGYALAFGSLLLLGGRVGARVGYLYINVVFAVVAVVGAVVTVREPVRRGPRPAIDVPGAVLVTAGLFAVVLGLGNAQTGGWAEVRTWGPLTAGAVLVAAFVLVQRRSRHPLLPLRVLGDRDRLGG